LAIVKVSGIETEYGILVRGTESNPVLASSLLINAYVEANSPEAHHDVPSWNFDDERPDVDARGFSLESAMPPAVEMHLVNAVLTNGARYYVDHAHPEISTPECANAWESLIYDCAGEEIIRQSMSAVNRTLPNGVEMLLYKNNSDGKGNSYGCHENFLVAREVPFGRIVSQITPHFVTRQVFAGAGKVGSEMLGVSAEQVPFQLSQRADFFEEEVGLETTLKRPIVNTRDEPHCDPQKYRRLHVIVGDANMSQVATFLKVGTTSLILSLIEDDVLGSDLTLAHPVSAIRQVSYDPTLQQTLLMANGSRMTAMDIQWALLDKSVNYVNSVGYESVGGEVIGQRIINLWEEVLTGLERDPDSVADMVDWIAKKRIVDGMQSRHGLSNGDSRLRAIDLQYHDMRADKCLASRAGLRTLVEASQVERAIRHAPDTTRAYFRGQCLERWPDQVVSANWDCLVLDVGRGPLRRVPMMEPLRGTKDLVGQICSESDTLLELLDRLGAEK
jgi:proteasome accessory factor A